MLANTKAKKLIVVLLVGLFTVSCLRKDDTPLPPARNEPTRPASPLPAAASQESAGFQIDSVPVGNAPSGSFPYVGLIEGYTPTKSKFTKEVPFDKYELFDGSKIVEIEGRLATIGAEGQGASAHEIFRTYESLIGELGGVKVYEGADPKHTDHGKPGYEDRRHRHGFKDDRTAVYVLRTPESEIWLEAYVSSARIHKEEYFVTVIEKQSLAVRASLLNAQEMKSALDAVGHVALYINFDFNKADIRADSQPIIDEVVKLLQNDKTLKLTIEGHTDNIGNPEYNLQLSEARAKSVRSAVMSKGINGLRLTALGYGLERPIADNGHEEGRALNRRVELVKAG